MWLLQTKIFYYYYEYIDRTVTVDGQCSDFYFTGYQRALQILIEHKYFNASGDLNQVALVGKSSSQITWITYTICLDYTLRSAIQVSRYNTIQYLTNNCHLFQFISVINTKERRKDRPAMGYEEIPDTVITLCKLVHIYLRTNHCSLQCRWSGWSLSPSWLQDAFLVYTWNYN